MDSIVIEGGLPLRGSVQISGAKNAALPILIASLLTDEACEFERVPDLDDITSTLKILGHLGMEAKSNRPNTIALRPRGELRVTEAPYDLVRKMRASFLVLGPILARHGRARVSLPGGCAIGARPIGLHLKGLEALGAKIELEGGYVTATAERLKGARIELDFPSVGATEHLLMSACLAQGTTRIENCAREPEIVDLVQALIKMGAKIHGHGTEKIQIEGVERLHGCRHSIIGDRIEAGTYLAAAIATRGKVRAEGIASGFLDAVLSKFTEAGALCTSGDDWIEVEMKGRPRPTDVSTLPFPGFPTDMQAQMMAVLCMADGASVITENVFENRFMHVPELARLGADISIRGKSALVRGRPELMGAPVMATDLRASASLVVAGLAAQGMTTINRVYHLDRGYEHLEKKLSGLGARVRRQNG